MLYRLDGLILIHGLDMHRHDLAGLHPKEIRQHPVADIRCGNCKEAHGPIHAAHPEYPAVLKMQSGRGDEVLDRQSGRHQPFPVKAELLRISHVKLLMHQFKAFPAV